MPARRTLSGTVVRQYGSPDFVITPYGTFGGINHDLTYAIYYAFKILFSPKTIGKAAGVAEIEYVTVSSHATWPYEEYNFVQKVCYEFSAKGSQGNGPDLFLSPISIPNSQTDPTSQVPIIPVGVQTLVNVPVSINFTGALPSNILNSSVPVTLQAGSYSSTQNISIANLVANQNQMLVPFLVTLQSNDVGLKTLVASVNATRVISESNFSNNEAHLNVRVGDAKLSIIGRALGVDGEPIGVETKTGISGGENISLVLVSRTNFKLVDANGVTQPATYVMDAESKAFSFPIGTNALFRNQMVILFGEGEVAPKI